MNKYKNDASSLLQFVKFGLVGVANTGVDWLFFYLLINTILSGSETVAKALSFIVAMLNSYLFNTIWTFKGEYDKATGGDKSAAYGIFGKFVLVSGIGWAINTLAFDYDRFHLDQSKIVSLIIASGAAIIWNFFANKFWTYKK
ncbi:MAG: GtrA family protein [Candidatus Berkelbacteria bacterium]